MGVLRQPCGSSVCRLRTMWLRGCRRSDGDAKMMGSVPDAQAVKSRVQHGGQGRCPGDSFTSRRKNQPSAGSSGCRRVIWSGPCTIADTKFAPDERSLRVSYRSPNDRSCIGVSRDIHVSCYGNPLGERHPIFDAQSSTLSVTPILRADPPSSAAGSLKCHHACYELQALSSRTGHRGRR